MHLARSTFRILLSFATLVAPACALAANATPDRIPLIGTAPTAPAGPQGFSSATGVVKLVDPATVPCVQTATFDDLPGGAAPGVDYDGIVQSGGVLFAERFAGQTLGTVSYTHLTLPTILRV